MSTGVVSIAVMSVFLAEKEKATNPLEGLMAGL
jgi:hypothetical protein